LETLLDLIFTTSLSSDKSTSFLEKLSDILISPSAVLQPITTELPLISLNQDCAPLIPSFETSLSILHGQTSILTGPYSTPLNTSSPIDSPHHVKKKRKIIPEPAAMTLNTLSTQPPTSTPDQPLHEYYSESINPYQNPSPIEYLLDQLVSDSISIFPLTLESLIASSTPSPGQQPSAEFGMQWSATCATTTTTLIDPPFSSGDGERQAAAPKIISKTKSSGLEVESYTMNWIP